jgi:rRNA processing protein Krr1/Pno1
VVAVKIRLSGLPAEIDQAVSILTDAPALDVIEVSNPYPNRGDSRIVRVYIEAQLRPGSKAMS